MSVLVEGSDRGEVRIIVTKASFKRFKNGGDIGILNELHERIKTQIGILELQKGGKKLRVKNYTKISIDRWSSRHFLSYIRDKHKEEFGEPIRYINDDRQRTLACLQNLWRWFESKSLTKKDMIDYIDWLYGESETTEVSIQHFLFKRMRNEWLEVRRIKTKDKPPVISSKFKKMMGATA